MEVIEYMRVIREKILYYRKVIETLQFGKEVLVEFMKEMGFI
jgi:hypothetical protein